MQLRLIRHAQIRLARRHQLGTRRSIRRLGKRNLQILRRKKTLLLRNHDLTMHRIDEPIQHQTDLVRGKNRRTLTTQQNNKKDTFHKRLLEAKSTHYARICSKQERKMRAAITQPNQ